MTSNLTYILLPTGAERLVIHPTPRSLCRECLYMPVNHRKAYPAPKTSYRPIYIVLQTANKAKYKRRVRTNIRWPTYHTVSHRSKLGRQASQVLACSTVSTLIKMRYYTDLRWDTYGDFGMTAEKSPGTAKHVHVSSPPDARLIRHIAHVKDNAARLYVCREYQTYYC